MKIKKEHKKAREEEQERTTGRRISKETKSSMGSFAFLDEDLPKDFYKNEN